MFSKPIRFFFVIFGGVSVGELVTLILQGFRKFEAFIGHFKYRHLTAKFTKTQLQPHVNLPFLGKCEYKAEEMGDNRGADGGSLGSNTYIYPVFFKNG